MRANPTVSRNGNILTGSESGTSVSVGNDGEIIYIYAVNSSDVYAGGEFLCSSEL